MQIDDDALSLVMALGENPDLRSKFYAISDLPENLRVEALRQYASEIKKATDDDRIIKTFEMLNNPEFFSQALKSIKEMHPQT